MTCKLSFGLGGGDFGTLGLPPAHGGAEGNAAEKDDENDRGKRFGCEIHFTAPVVKTTVFATGQMASDVHSRHEMH